MVELYLRFKDLNQHIDVSYLPCIFPSHKWSYYKSKEAKTSGTLTCPFHDLDDIYTLDDSKHWPYIFIIFLSGAIGNLRLHPAMPT